jgi:hypothetical protein
LPAKVAPFGIALLLCRLKPELHACFNHVRSSASGLPAKVAPFGIAPLLCRLKPELHARFTVSGAPKQDADYEDARGSSWVKSKKEQENGRSKQAPGMGKPCQNAGKPSSKDQEM